ncbi:MAG: VWA domain-containing protein [Gammaproteobacteria bacterium]|nr:VWA domain-containing protein [Gammaproteobacteria bacterium]
MIEFHWPLMAFCLPLPLLVRLFWPRFVRSGQELPTEGRRTTLLHPTLVRLETSFKARRPRTAISGKLQALLLTLLWIALTLTAMRPQLLEPHTEIRSEGYDLMLSIDTSRSMTALDFSSDGRPVSRMAVVKGVMGKFIENRPGDRVGLVIFGNQAFVQAPLTLDLRAARQILDEIEPGMAGNATAMGDAIGLSVKKLRERPEGSRVLLLVTDGENTAGLIPPGDAASLAKREGVRIYAIGVGSNQKEVMIRGSDGQYRSESDIGLNEATLRNIAETTGGAYFRATNTSALVEISERINALEKTETDSHTVLIPHPLYRWPLAVALLMLLLLGLFPEGRMRMPGSTNSNA